MMKKNKKNKAKKRLKAIANLSYSATSSSSIIYHPPLPKKAKKDDK